MTQWTKRAVGEWFSDWRAVHTRDLVATLVVAAICAYAWPFLFFNSPNERARIYSTHAMVEHGQLSVERERNEWGDTYDLSRYDGEWFSNKPPGSSLLGAVWYAPLRLVAEADRSYETLLLWFRLGLMVPLSLLGFWGFRRLARRLGLSEPTIDLSSAGWVLGTAAFCYTTAYFSHHIVAVLFVLALWMLVAARDRLRETTAADPDRADAETSPGGEAGAGWLLFGAGAALGLAGMTEYHAGASCLLFAGFVVSHREFRTARTLGAFAAGALPFVIGLLWYQYAAFDHPLRLSYWYHRGGGVASITLPRWEYFTGLMVSPHRGVLTTGPWLIFALAGGAVLWRDDSRRLAGLLAAMVVWRIAFLSGYEWWNGDWGFGPRHMVPVLGVASLLAGVGIERVREHVVGEVLSRGLVVAGIGYNQLQNAFLGILPLWIHDPLSSIVGPMSGLGIPSPNLVQYLIAPDGLVTLIPLAVVVTAVCGYLMVGGLNVSRGRLRLVAIVVGALIPVALVFGYVVSSDRAPEWSERKHERLLKRISNWHVYEIAWRKGALERERRRRGRVGGGETRRLAEAPGSQRGPGECEAQGASSPRVPRRSWASRYSATRPASRLVCSADSEAAISRQAARLRSNSLRSSASSGGASSWVTRNSRAFARSARLRP